MIYRPILLLAVLFGLVSCRPPASSRAAPAATPPTVVIIHSDGVLVKDKGGTRYQDPANKLSLAIAEGWVGTTTFPVSDEAPPAIGNVRLRMRLGPDPACVIDLAIEPPLVGEAPLQATVARGRELFYFAPAAEPVPALPVKGVWASTTLSAASRTTDLGYWMETSGGVLRLEGRFPDDRVAECKAGLDQMVESLGPFGETTERVSADKL